MHKAFAGRKVFLEFEAAMQVADVWINGKQRAYRMIRKWKALDIEIDGVWPRGITEVESQLDEWLAGKVSPVPMVWTIWG